MARGVDAGLLAATMAWAVFGAALYKFQTPNRKIETIVKPVVLNASQ